MNVKNQVLLVMRIRREFMKEFGWSDDDMNATREGIIAPLIQSAVLASLANDTLSVALAAI